LNAIIDRTTRSRHVTVSRVMSGSTVLSLRELIREVPIATHVRDLASTIVMATHPSWAGSPEPTRRFVRYGASPRGAQALVLGAKVRALAEGRYNVSVEDIKALARPAMRHGGGLAAVVVLSFKAGLGTTALVVAPALVALGVVAGATYGLTKRVDPHDIARLADRAFDLADRVATALEWADHPDRTPLVDALV